MKVAVIAETDDWVAMATEYPALMASRAMTGPAWPAPSTASRLSSSIRTRPPGG